MFLPADAEAAAKKAGKGKGPKKAKGAVKAGKVTKKGATKAGKVTPDKAAVAGKHIFWVGGVSAYFLGGVSAYFWGGVSPWQRKTLKIRRWGFCEGVPLTHIGTGAPNV